MAAAGLRLANPEITCEEARGHLATLFGDRGKVSSATIGRVWRAHGVSNPAMGDPSRFVRVTHYSGGAALALVAAAEAESGVSLALARAAREAAEARVADQVDEKPLVDPVPGRDDLGRFTAEYNRATREGLEPGQRDSRWDQDAAKRERRDLASLSILALNPETMAQRLLTMGMVPLVSGQRGFDGMDAPRGHWLRLLGWPAYRPSTLDKTLSQLGVLGVDEALWEAHGQIWGAKAREWAKDGPHWLQIVRYLDITAEPHWTQHFAKSGKVSRTGRVQPCLQRAMLTAGPGVPLRMESIAGTHDLKRALRELLAEDLAQANAGADKQVPEWITVVDAEAAAPTLLAELASLPQHRFVTVLKGGALKSASITEMDQWFSYREKDQLCEVEVVLTGGLTLRGVWMQRGESRNPRRTLFVTDARREELSTAEVADVYLSRWPNQEALFRRGRQGAGLEHSHGFSGEYVTHVALEKKQTLADRRVERLEAEVQSAGAHRLDTWILNLDQEDLLLAEVAEEAARQAERRVQEVEKRHRKAQAEQERLATMPPRILQRDTTRENVATSLTMSMMMLVEWVLREYMGAGFRMELQTFLNYFLYLPVQVHTSWHQVRYRIEIGKLSEPYADMLRKACKEINRREIKRDDRLLIFETFHRPDQDE